MLQKNSLCAKSSHKQHLFQQHDFPFNVYKSVANTNSKEQGLLMDQDRGKPGIEIFSQYWYYSKWHQEELLDYVLVTFPSWEKP